MSAIKCHCFDLKFCKNLFLPNGNDVLEMTKYAIWSESTPSGLWLGALVHGVETNPAMLQ